MTEQRERVAKAIFCYNGRRPAPWDDDDLPDHKEFWAMERRTAEMQADAAIAAMQSAAPKVKPLVWGRGIVDYAKPHPGMKYVACSTTPVGSWAWWLDEAPETRAVFTSEQAAKAAAQADYERRILDALE